MFDVIWILWRFPRAANVWHSSMNGILPNLNSSSSISCHCIKQVPKHTFIHIYDVCIDSRAHASLAIWLYTWMFRTIRQNSRVSIYIYVSFAFLGAVAASRWQGTPAARHKCACAMHHCVFIYTSTCCLGRPSTYICDRAYFTYSMCRNIWYIYIWLPKKTKL